MTGDGRAELRDHERLVADLKADYVRAAEVLAPLIEGRSRKAERLAAFHAWRGAGTSYYNAFDRRIVLGALVGADREPKWHTDCAETAANLLEEIHRHYETLSRVAEGLGLPPETFRPSRTAFAAMQRMVKETNPEIARHLRDEFVKLDLPTHGFDREEAVKADTRSGHEVATWERIVAACGAATILAVVLVVVLRNEPFSDPNQVVFLRIVVSLSVATFGAVIPGFLHVRIGWRRNAVLAGGALALFVVTFFFTPTVLPSPPPRPEQSPAAAERTLDDIDIADVRFADHEGDARAPRLDIKLSNRGTRAAFVKRVNVEVKRVWRLSEWPAAVGVVVPPSHNYVVRLKPQDAPYTVSLPVSHGLKPDETDRFTVQLEEDPWPSSNTIYLVDVEIVANGNDLTYRKTDMLFLVTQAGTSFPTEADFWEMVHAQRNLGRPISPDEVKKGFMATRSTVLEVAMLGGMKSPALQRLVESAKRSDLR